MYFRILGFLPLLSILFFLEIHTPNTNTEKSFSLNCTRKLILSTANSVDSFLYHEGKISSSRKSHMQHVHFWKKHKNVYFLSNLDFSQYAIVFFFVEDIFCSCYKKFSAEFVMGKIIFFYKTKERKSFFLVLGYVFSHFQICHNCVKYAIC